ncbi:MAG: c-type cytochrome [Betaproteobacteria bacterium]
MSPAPCARRGAAALFAAALFAAPAPGASAADLETIKKKAELCVACHGVDGNSANPAIPTLAGQPKQFITTQLVMYREGNRKNPQMAPFTANMSNADINDYGTYFAAQRRISAGHSIPPEKVAAGRLLTEKYNCVQCHGPTLLGLQHIPGLAGQQPEYLKTQLEGFKASTRFDMDGNMTSAARPLTPADIDLISEYLASLQ